MLSEVGQDLMGLSNQPIPFITLWRAQILFSLQVCRASGLNDKICLVGYLLNNYNIFGYIT